MLVCFELNQQDFNTKSKRWGFNAIGTDGGRLGVLLAGWGFKTVVFAAAGGGLGVDGGFVGSGLGFHGRWIVGR